jgi:hypothetical protein
VQNLKNPQLRQLSRLCLSRCMLADFAVHESFDIGPELSALCLGTPLEPSVFIVGSARMA